MSKFIIILHGQHIQRKQVDNCLKFYYLTKNIYIVCATCIFVNICCLVFAQLLHLYDVTNIFFLTLTICKNMFDTIIITTLNYATFYANNLSSREYLDNKVFLSFYVAFGL